MDVLKRRPDGLRALAIDIPIGLLAGRRVCDNAARTGRRACDNAARKLLGKHRGCSVFSPPCRETLSAVDYSDACHVNQALTGKRISRQAWSIAPRIKAVDDVITPLHQSWVFEVHPEVCFWHLAEWSEKANYLDEREVYLASDRIAANLVQPARNLVFLGR